MNRLVAAVVATVVTTTVAASCTDVERLPHAAVGLQVRGCDPGVTNGSGMFVEVDGFDEPLVLTSAHTLRAAREIVVSRGDHTASGAGTIVAFDPEMDLAYLTVDGLTTFRPLPVGGAEIDEDERGAAYVVRDGERVALPVTLKRSINIRTEDIYVAGETDRPGYELGADIDAGDSGGAVVIDGRVIGVIWARSRENSERAYAIDPVRAGTRTREQLRTGDLGDVDISRCR